MSMRTEQVRAEIVKTIQGFNAEQLEALYNQLHDADHIVYVGEGKFEHQDMDD